jgi:raffinose/stachyose/melibiose transport system permease protein
MVFNALKDPAEIAATRLVRRLSRNFGNLVEAWERGGFATTMRNSAIITVGTVLGVCLISGLAAYALGRLNVPGGDALLVIPLRRDHDPRAALRHPAFFLWVRLGLSNTHLGLIVVYWAIFTPFTTLLLRSYLLSLPRELEEAARVDGAGELQVLTRIVIRSPGRTPGGCAGLRADGLE